MSVSVTLEFIPSDEPDLKALHVYESSAVDGTFMHIDETESIGTYPNWITRYTTDKATQLDYWFAISWENTAGVEGELSAPMQGGSTSLVSELVNRVLLRDPTLNKIIVGQEAEMAISIYFNTTDPYSIPTDSVTPLELSGLTYLTMARCYIIKVATMTSAGAANKWTTGLVSMDTSITSKSAQAPWDNIENLMKLANIQLGRNYSVILQAKEIAVAGGYKISTGPLLIGVSGVDLSRGIAMAVTGMEMVNTD